MVKMLEARAHQALSKQSLLWLVDSAKVEGGGKKFSKTVGFCLRKNRKSRVNQNAPGQGLRGALKLAPSTEDSCDRKLRLHSQEQKRRRRQFKVMLLSRLAWLLQGCQINQNRNEVLFFSSSRHRLSPLGAGCSIKTQLACRRR